MFSIIMLWKWREMNKYTEKQEHGGDDESSRSVDAVRMLTTIRTLIKSGNTITSAAGSGGSDRCSPDSHLPAAGQLPSARQPLRARAGITFPCGPALPC